MGLSSLGSEEGISGRKVSLTLLAGIRCVRLHGRECASHGLSGLPGRHLHFDPAIPFLESPPHERDALCAETRDNLDFLPGAAKCTMACPRCKYDAAFSKNVAALNGQQKELQSIVCIEAN